MTLVNLTLPWCVNLILTSVHHFQMLLQIEHLLFPLPCYFPQRSQPNDEINIVILLRKFFSQHHSLKCQCFFYQKSVPQKKYHKRFFKKMTKTFPQKNLKQVSHKDSRSFFEKLDVSSTNLRCRDVPHLNAMRREARRRTSVCYPLRIHGTDIYIYHRENAGTLRMVP